MTPDMKRLYEAAEKEMSELACVFAAGDGYHIVRAVLMELREVSPEGFAAMEEALRRPRTHVGHRFSDDVRGAYIALDAYVDLILDTKARREAALCDLAQMDGKLL